MKTISAQMQTHIEGGVTTLATLWRIKRRDGTNFGFTDFQSDLTFDDGEGSLKYLAKSGVSRTAVRANSTLSVDNLEIMSRLEVGIVQEDDVRAGLWDFAEVRLSLVNYKDLTMGNIKISRGFLGEVSIRDHDYLAEFRSLTQTLSQTIGEVYTVGCLADVYDSRCGLNKAASTDSTTVEAIDSGNTVITYPAGALKEHPLNSGNDSPDGHHTGGLITFTSGLNAGISLEIHNHVASTRELTAVEPWPFTVAPGDAFDVHPGCDKVVTTCVTKFNNVANFRGFPHVPGTDQITRYPDAPQA